MLMNGTESRMVIQPTKSWRMYLQPRTDGYTERVILATLALVWPCILSHKDARVCNLQLALQKRNELVDGEVITLRDNLFQEAIEQLRTMLFSGMHVRRVEVQRCQGGNTRMNTDLPARRS